MRSSKRAPLIVFLLGIAMACSDSPGVVDDRADSGGGPVMDSGDGASVECPLVAPSCPSECGAIDGKVLEVERGCTGRTVRLGCWPKDAGGTADVACIKSTTMSDVFWLPSGTYAQALAETEEYEPCSEAERSVAISAEPCSGIAVPPDAGGCPNDRETCPDECNAFTGQRYDPDAHCLLPATQLGCFDKTGNVTQNGGCVKEIATDEVWIVESGSYANQLLLDPAFAACALDDLPGSTGALQDCP